MYYLKFTPLTTNTTADNPILAFNTRRELAIYLLDYCKDDSVINTQFRLTMPAMLDHVDLTGSFDAGHLFISKG